MQSNYLQEKPIGYLQSNVDAATTVTAISGASTIFGKGPVLLRIVAEAQAVRWRDDGTAPTATVGQPLAVGVELYYTGAAKNLQFISQVAGAIINITAYSHTQPNS